MQKESFVVRYITANNCFVKLPDYWLRKLGGKETALEILHNNVKHFVTCSSKPSPNDKLSISATFARSLNVKQDDEVLVTSLDNVPSVIGIKIMPQSVHDHEILALQKEKIQSTLLAQVRVVAKDRPIVVWVSKFSYITIITESLEPDYTYGMLQELTEVHVSDVLPKLERDQSPKAFSESDVIKSDEYSTSSEAEEVLKAFRNRTASYVFRVCNLPKINYPFGRNNKYDEIMCSPFHAFVSEQHLPRGIDLTNEHVHCTIRKVSEVRQNLDAKSTNFLKSEESSAPKSPAELTILLFLVESVKEASEPTQFSPIPMEVDWLYRGVDATIYLSDTIMTNLKLKVGNKVILQLSNRTTEKVPCQIELYPHSPLTAEDFKKYVERFSNFRALLLNSCCVVIEDSNPLFTIKIIPETCTWGEFSKINLEKMRIVEKRRFEYFPHEDIPKYAIKKQPEHLELKCQTVVYDKCKNALELSLGLDGPHSFDTLRENILICGQVGSGKTTICNTLIKVLQTGPYFVHTNFIDCKALKGKKVDLLQKIITSAIVECVHYQPSLIFLENLECITWVSSADEENTPDSINAARTTDMIMNVVKRYQEEHRFSVIATCTSVEKIGKKLRPAKGCDFFRTAFTIDNPDERDRRTLLTSELACAMDPVELAAVCDIYGIKTEGWLPQDIVDVARKALFIGQKRIVASRRTTLDTFVTEKDVESAFNDYTPMSLRDLPLYRDSKYTWSDIGGLNDVKKCLITMIQWPLMYPEIYKKSPIKLQNGVLLYGMPGTGKTMIAKAIANECRVNLINIKGPELLSKYIGISEEFVRNVFERAHRAKPSVLFFDEFESLAPRRGHDSTGVTDRVVNQLLTQLDGVEDREGVAVVAASSRPDLLDPALLRPGRLDKLLHCPPPDQNDRWEILKALCKAQQLDMEDSKLRNIAELSSGFTGADLNAVVTQAKLMAVEEATANIPWEKLRRSDVNVTHAHLELALKATRPSLSPSDKQRYRQIYAKFSGKNNIVEEILKNQKATLA